MSKGIMPAIAEIFRMGEKRVEVASWWGELTPLQVAERLGCYCALSVGVLARGRDSRLIFSRDPLNEYRDKRGRITQKVIR